MGSRIKILFMIWVLIALAGLVSASNMGFKLSYQLQTNTAGNNVNWVSLPYFNSYSKASDIVSDINNDCGPGSVTAVKRFDTINNLTITHIAALPTLNNFSINPGESYGVVVSTPCTWVIVGSHNNNYDPGGGSSILLKVNASGNNVNWVSVPYHTTLGKANDLCNEINNQNGMTVVTSIKIFDTATNLTTTHICALPVINNFTLDPGKGVAVVVNQNATWQPSHY